MNISERKVLYVGHDTEITNHAAALIISEAYRAVEDHGRFSLVLAGGNSPRFLYEKLAQGVTTDILERYALSVPNSISGSKQNIHPLPPNTWLFQGDERCVPFDHPDSNYRMVKESLLLHSGIAKDHFFRMAGENSDTELAARAYEDAIRTFFKSEEGLQEDDFPVFDLIVLGLGEDGHTASLFRDNTEALQEEKRWVITVNAPRAKPPGMRLTITIPVINHARNVLFFTNGRKKCELANNIFLDEENEVPASFVNPENGRLFWFAAQP